MTVENLRAFLNGLPPDSEVILYTSGVKRPLVRATFGVEVNNGEGVWPVYLHDTLSLTKTLALEVDTRKRELKCHT